MIQYSSPWNHRGMVEAAVGLSGGGRVKRRVFISLTGPTDSAHIAGEMACHAHKGRLTEAMTFIDTAVAGTRGQQTPRLLVQLQLGQADRAAVLIDQGIVMFGTPFDRDRQYYLTYLAEALARPGQQRELEAAAGHGIEEIYLAESLSSTLNVNRIRSLTRVSEATCQAPAGQDALEQAKALLEGKNN